MTSQTQAVSRYMKPKQIAQLLGIGRSTWWKFVKDGEVSRGIKLGDRLTVWPVEEIDAFLEKKRKAMTPESTQTATVAGGAA